MAIKESGIVKNAPLPAQGKQVQFRPGQKFLPAPAIVTPTVDKSGIFRPPTTKIGNPIKPTPAEIRSSKKAAGIYRPPEYFFKKKVNEISSKTQEQSLFQEARKYKSAEEFVSKIQGSATQYGDYTPQFRHLGMEDYKNVTELGVKPDEMVTIYRGIDDVTGKIPRKINDGDFVTTDFDSAMSYAGKDNVVSMKVPAKTLYTDAIDDFKADPFYVGSEYVYTTQKVEPLTKSQLTDIWNKANKKPSK